MSDDPVGAEVTKIESTLPLLPTYNVYFCGCSVTPLREEILL